MVPHAWQRHHDAAHQEQDSYRQGQQTSRELRSKSGFLKRMALSGPRRDDRAVLNGEFTGLF
jgi:hypothetical protein